MVDLTVSGGFCDRVHTVWHQMRDPSLLAIVSGQVLWGPQRSIAVNVPGA